MTVIVRPYRGGPSLEVDVRVELPDGSTKRYRRRFKNGKTVAQAHQFGERVQSEISSGRWKGGRKSKQEKPIPMLAAFAERYLQEICPANRDKPSTMRNKTYHLRRHILPEIGAVRIDQVDAGSVVRLKKHLEYMKRGSCNNHLATLGGLLKAAVQVGVIERVPVEVKMLPRRKQSDDTWESYSFEEYDRLVSAAKEEGPRARVAVLLAGDAGLRKGEVLAVKWSDLLLDGESPIVTVGRTAWAKTEVLPKSGAARRVPLTHRLVEALRELQSWTRSQLLRAGGASPVDLENYRALDRFVLSKPSGARYSGGAIRYWMKKVQSRANVRAKGKVHVLRHTFCSHLAARGVPVIDIKELAGHSSIKTTEKYLHVLPGARERGIAKLQEGYEERSRPRVVKSRAKRVPGKRSKK